MRLNITIYILITILLLSCKNYYNHMIHWADNIPAGTLIDSVKINQPEFVVIDWNKPAKSDTSKSFKIIKVKGSTDVLKITNTLNFINDRYVGRFAKK